MTFSDFSFMFVGFRAWFFRASTIAGHGGYLIVSFGLCGSDSDCWLHGPWSMEGSKPWYLGDGGDLGEPLNIFNLDSGNLLAIEHGDYPADLPIEHGGYFHSLLLTFTRPGMST